MACNCNPIIPCTSCQSGVPCNCPPSYPVPNTTVPCTCCPNGYTLSTSPNFVTPTNPTGQACFNPAGKQFIATIPCVPCEEITTTDCVQYSGIIPLTCNPSGINPGDTVTTILDKLCFTSSVNIMAFIEAIATNQTLLDGFCNLVGLCGAIPGTTTPILGPVSWTIP